MVTDHAVRRYRKFRKTGWVQEIAAAKAGLSVKSGRKYEMGLLPSQLPKKEREWRTRPDPLEKDWENFVVPLLKQDTKGRLQSTTILDLLKEKKSDEYDDSNLRTLQRRVRDWRATEGPEKEVFFPQEHEIGREAQVDFTHATELGVTIAGVPFEHLFFAMKLNYSGHHFVELAFGETFEALAQGIQNAFWSIGGVTEIVCTDNLSAATHELKKTGGRCFGKRYTALSEHVGFVPRRINARCSNENGVVERGHGTFKTALEQELIVRDCRDFRSVDEYLKFVDSVVAKLNAQCSRKFIEEKQCLLTLPSSKLPNWTETQAKVYKWSTIRVASHTYSVPSRLIGHKVDVRLYPNHVEVLYNGKVMETMPRLRGNRTYRIDYRHISHSLVRKPGAFARYRYREDLFPSLVFRQAYDKLREWRGERADVEYVRILHLAATNMESQVDLALETALSIGERFEYVDIRDLVAPPALDNVVHLVPKREPDLKKYNQLTPAHQGGARAS